MSRAKVPNITPSESQPVLRSQKAANIPDYVWEVAKEELRMVKGRFRILEKGKEGGYEKICFRKYPAEICPMFNKVMFDNEIYEIPLYAARFINGYDSNAKQLNGKLNTCSVPKHGFRMSNPTDLRPSVDAMTENGPIPVPKADITRYDRRFAFESLEFSGDLG